MRVLLVEDSAELVALLKKGLAQGGFSADSVRTAADAAHALATMRYAAMVLDRCWSCSIWRSERSRLGSSSSSVLRGSCATSSIWLCWL